METTALEMSGLEKIGEPSAAILTVASKLPPRDLALVEKNIKAAIATNPELAASCIYCRPVGRDENSRQKFAIGPSVRFTELGQQCFGRLWLNGFSEIDNKGVKATYMCFDLGTMNITFGECSKSIIKSGGQRYSDTMVETVTSAAMSIARRNALTQQMRPQLESCMVDAKQAAIKKWNADLDGDKALAAIHSDYHRRWGTLVEQLKELMESENSPEDKLILIIGIRNYLIDNPTAYKDVFGCEAVASKAKKEAVKQTEKQKFATLKLQLETAGKVDALKIRIDTFASVIAKAEKEFDEADFKQINTELEKLLATKDAK
jgi:hypothetical protein